MKTKKWILEAVLFFFVFPVFSQNLENRVLFDARANGRLDLAQSYFSVIPLEEIKVKKSELILTAFQGFSDGMKVLKDQSISVDMEDMQNLLYYGAGSGSVFALGLALEQGADINKKDGMQRTALMTACAFGKLDGVLFLLSKGADFQLLDQAGYTAATYLFYSNGGKDAPVSVSRPLSTEDMFGFFLFDPLSRLSLLKRLMETQVQDGRKRNIFHYLAITGGTAEEAAVFDHYFPDPEHSSGGVGELYLSLKIKDKRDKAIKALVLGQDNFGVTPAWLCVQTGNAELLKVILAFGGKPDVKGPNGATLAEEAVKNRQPECLLILLIAGADLNRVISGQNMTLKNYIIQSGYQELLE